MNSLISKYKDKLKSPKVLVIVGILGILLIFISSLFTEKEEVKATELDMGISSTEYREQLETDVKKIVSKITGNKNVTVIVTLESGMRYKYADIKEGSTEDKSEESTKLSSSESKQGYITVKTADGGEQALLVTTQMPEIRGVAIVCIGGDNELIAEKIENTVTAALNITSQRVSIAGGN
ncbi:MAG: hypothetical protein IJD45_01945 [Clostridia bacterium]|nr:hypothetical protein [Clostridia bacterium]